jgi:tetratricopeptide (TPR) repeat protein
VNATVAWSYQLLDADGRRMFRRLGALPGRFPIEAAAAVLAGHAPSPARTDEALCAAAGLIDKSLLLRTETAVTSRPLYDMLETVRAYAVLELTASGERDDAQEGLARYCTAEASLTGAELFGPSQAEWLDRVQDDLGNYRGALTWLIERDRPAEASDIAWSLMFFWAIRGHAAEGLRWCEQILNLPSLPAAAEAKARLGAGAMRYTRGELGHARTELTRALALAHETGNLQIVAHAENLLGNVEHADGNVNAARDRFIDSLEGFRALALPWGIGNSLTGMAAVVLAMGDATHAEHLLDEATSVLREAGPWFLAHPLFIRAILAVRRGKPDEAIVLMRESLTHIRKLHEKFAFVNALVPLAAAAVHKGDYAWAARILGALDAVTERTSAAVVDKSVNDLREQAERETRERLGEDWWTRAFAAGRGVSIDALLKDIDSALSSRGDA